MDPKILKDSNNKSNTLLTEQSDTYNSQKVNKVHRDVSEERKVGERSHKING